MQKKNDETFGASLCYLLATAPTQSLYRTIMREFGGRVTLRFILFISNVYAVLASGNKFLKIELEHNGLTGEEEEIKYEYQGYCYALAGATQCRNYLIQSINCLSFVKKIFYRIFLEIAIRIYYFKNMLTIDRKTRAKVGLVAMIIFLFAYAFGSVWLTGASDSLYLNLMKGLKYI